MRNLSFVSCLLLLAIFSPTALAIDGTWIGAGTGNYSDTTKWTGGIVAGGTGAAATVNFAGGNTTITQDAAVTLGSFQLTNSNNNNFNWAGGGTASTATVTWATSSGTPSFRLDTWFGKGYGIGGGSLTFAGSQGLTINVGSNSMNPSSSGLSWTGFSGILTITNGGGGDGTIDPQTGNTLPSQHLSLLPGSSGSITLGMFAGRDQTIGGFDGTAATYVRNNSTSFSSLTLGSNNENGNFAGYFGKNVNAASTDFRSNININKNGTGTQIFSGTNYSGGTTTVNAGTYLINGSHLATITASSNVAATTGTGGKYVIKSGSTLGGTGMIKPFDTAGGGVMVDIQSGASLAPGDPATNSGVGTLTFDQTNSAQTVLNFSTGGSVTFRLGSGNTNSKIAITGSASVGVEAFFNSTALNFVDLTGGTMAAGTYVLFQGDANTAFSGTPVLGTGLSNYPGSTVQISGTNVTLTLAPANLATALPNPPTGLTAMAGNNQVSLAWTAPTSGGAVSIYKVRRGTVSGTYTTTFSVTAPTASYVDTTAVNGTKYYYVVASNNNVGDSANSSEVNATPQGPVGVGVHYKAGSSNGMIASDVAGVVRLSRWNNLGNFNGSATTSLTNVLDSTGGVIAGMTVNVTGGSTSAPGSYQIGSESGNDTTFFASIFDQYDGSAGTIAVTGIPYATYDVYLFARDDGSDRAGTFTSSTANLTYAVRGGVGTPSSAAGYVQSTDTTNTSSSAIQQGNYVKFTGLTSSTFNCSFVAVAAGNGANRLKTPGFQIVATTQPAAVTTVPAVPANLQLVSGNNQNTIKWTASNTATQYAIFRSTTDGVFDYNNPLATIAASSNSYVDATALTGSTYYYVVRAINSIGTSSSSNEVVGSPYDTSIIRSVSVNLRSVNSYGMTITDVAGVRRVDHWNNLTGPALAGQSVALSAPKDNIGVLQTGMSVNYTGGTTGSGYDLSGTYRYDSSNNLANGETESQTGNETDLYTTAFDQYDGTPSSLAVTGIPYSSYDVVCYLRGETSTTRGGSVTIGGVTKYARSGAGVPTSDGFGYVESTATSLTGSSTPQGNYVRFSGLTGSSFNASILAQNMGDSTQRVKFCGFQIISNASVITPAPTAAPAAPANVAAFPGNSQVSITWSAAATATSYQIRRNTTLLATVAAPLADSPTSYVDVTAANGTSYSYTVAAVNSFGTGSNSAAAAATPAAPANPELVSPAEWQYSVSVSPNQADYAVTVTPDTERRAYLWVPPGCTKVRGLVFSLQNLIEQKMLEGAKLRQALTAANMGIVWVSGGSGNYTDMQYDPAAGPLPIASSANPTQDRTYQAAVELARTLTALSVESGYSEIKFCPVIQFQHSACSPFGWTRGVYSKAPMLGRVISIINKGFYPGSCPRGIPTMHLTSEWSENAVSWGTVWDSGDATSMRRLRGQQGTADSSQGTSSTQCLLSEFIQVGQGHYQPDYTQDSAAQQIFIDFIIKTAAARLPATWDGASYPTLTTLDQSTGYFIDVTKTGSGVATPVTLSQWQAARPDDPVAGRAFWFIDQAFAQEVADYQNAGFNKQAQFVTPVNPDGTFQNLFGSTGAAEYSPSFLGDGTSFKVKAAFVGRSPSFRQYNVGPVGVGSSPLQYIPACGALHQSASDTYQMWADRGAVVANTGNDGIVVAYTRGDANFRAVDRPIHINISLTNTTGTAQTLTFPSIPNQYTNNLHPIALNATATSGLPVQYFMIAGPYLAGSTSSNNSTLTPQTLPAKIKFPMRVRVGAYQWGSRASGAQYQSAGVQYQEFWLGLAPVTLNVNASGSTTFAVSDLLSNAGFDPSTISSVTVSSTSAQGGTVSISGSGTSGNIVYTPPANFSGTDSFTYTLTLAAGGTSTWTANVTVNANNAPSQNITSITSSNGSLNLTFYGIAGMAYRVEYTNSLTSPITWTNLGPATDAGAGQFTFTDTPPANSPSRFYRVAYP